MKAYLGIRDAELPYLSAQQGGADTLFGIDLRERNFARVRVNQDSAATSPTTQT